VVANSCAEFVEALQDVHADSVGRPLMAAAPITDLWRGRNP
jgi:hypothetical protein